MGAYYSSGIIYHTFDLTINKEISLLKEIDPLKLPTLKSKMKLQIQNELDKVHKDFTEEDWINAFGDKVTYNKSFKVTAIENNLLENYYFKNGKLNILITDYFGFPSATKNMDLTFEITIPFSELDIYLKENSILNNLK
ncbi:MAG: hypothetical protein IPP81_19155 [Chitinophagaceae bacterium]|nr:hypothetical protein [Chitinophagaceae bacterium]